MNPQQKPSSCIHPKGERHPGSGRVKGTPNRVTVEVRRLVGELLNDPRYQARLRRDFALRKLHPTIEGMVWAYHCGRPRQDVNFSGSVDLTARLEVERRAFLALDLPELEAIAAESQRLVDRALALASARVSSPTPQPIDIPLETGDLLKVSEESLTIMHGSDNSDYRNPAEVDTAGEGDGLEGEDDGAADLPDPDPTS